LIRKGIHMMSLSIPIAYYFLPRDVMLMIIIPLTLFFVLGDVMRTFHEPSFHLYHRIFGKMLRPHEKTRQKKTLNGASWVLISATLCIFVFPKLIAITAFAILIVSDTIAALIGRRYGTKRFNDKSLEGSTAFVISAGIVILLTPKVAYAPVEYFIALIAAVFGAIAEVLSFDIIDDNFAIPIAIGSTLWLLYILFLPELNVHILNG
jgi:dolichol kinase